VLLETTSLDPWIRQKFLQEMEALSRIDHPGVVGVLDSGLTAEGKQFLVMQYIEGVTLRSAIEPGGMNFGRAAGIIRQIGQALAAAHEKGVWHRDLKPENIMLQRLGGEDHVKLIDFGIAGIQDSQFTGEKTKVAGSLSYMAPEQFSGHPCEASDIYAYGVVAYEILTGTLPGETGESRPKLPEAAERTIRKALSLRPEDRQSSAREFSEELYRTLSGSDTARRSAMSAVPGTVEMAHVLFTDLVGYSLLPMDRQKEYLGELQQIVRESPQFQAAELAGDIISLPTGDGMALAFFGDPTAPAQCALEVASGLKNKPHLKLRMGIHSGPVYRVADVNANANVAGGGINMAQRVMDCGDAGHILMSKTVADVLLQLSQWSPYLTDLGECTVKHGVKIHLYSLATAELGNPEKPKKLGAAAPRKANRKLSLAAAAVLMVAAASGGMLWFGGSKAPRDERSIAVLPFVDMSPEKDQEYLSDGIAEELRDALAKLPGLRVTGPFSSSELKGKIEDLGLIGKKLNVAAILQGSVRKQGSRARVAVQLIKAEDGSLLWSETFERDMNDILAVEQEIAREVTGALKLTLLVGKAAIPIAKSTNVEAHNFYLQGRYFLARDTEEDHVRAASYFKQAINKDPGYAPTWVGLADVRIAQAGAGEIDGAEGYQQAREAAEKALSLDAQLAEAHSAMAEIKMLHDWDWNGAEESYRRALALNAGDASVLRGAGSLARILGRLDDSIQLYRRAIEIEPVGGHKNLGLALLYAGRQEEAKAAFEKALEIKPQTPSPHAMLARLHLAQSHPREALGEAEKMHDDVWRPYGLALAYHALGRKRESDAALKTLIEFPKRAAWLVAEVYAFRGETDLAFEWLERAYADRDAGLAEMKMDPLLEKLRGTPRYQMLFQKMRLPL
jgi:TolB-like protein/class 3 adenylate cyclase/Flp pilus assembly protein TadD